MKNNKKTPAWSPAQLIRLSQNLAEGYGFSKPHPAHAEPQGWTTEKLLKLSAAKSL